VAALTQPAAVSSPAHHLG